MPLRTAKTGARSEFPAPVPATFAIEPKELSKTVRLDVVRGLYVRGVVEDPLGNPVPAAYVEVAGSMHTSGAGESDGTFAIGPVPPGEYEVRAWDSRRESGLGPSERQPVVAGDADVVLRLSPGASIFGRAVSQQGGPYVGSVLVSSSGRAPEKDVHRGMLVEDGSFRFENLMPGHYDAVILTEDGRAGVARGLVAEARDEIEEVRISLAPAGFVDVVFPDCDLGLFVEVTVGGALLGHMQPWPGSSFLPVPPGPCKLELLRPDEGALETRHVDVVEGETIEVVFESTE